MIHEITTVHGDLGDLLHQSFCGSYRSKYIKVDGVVMPEGYKKFMESIENFEVRDDDVWLCTFPKTGTTWTQEMVWCIANDLDFERSKIPLVERFVFFDEEALLVSEFLGPMHILQSLHENVLCEYALLIAYRVCTLVDFAAIQRDHPELEIPNTDSQSISCIENSPSPRFIKTHLPFHLLPRQIRSGEKNPKIISVFRNAKDTCISYYHHCVLLEGYQGSFEDFCKLFLGDSLVFAPFWTNVLSYWRKKIQDNVLILSYADMKRDLPSTIRKTAKFMGKNLTSDQVSSLNDHLSFSNMKKNPAVNNEAMVAFCQTALGIERNGSFMRSGTTDQWKSELTPEVVKRFDDWTRHHSKGTSLSFAKIIE